MSYILITMLYSILALSALSIGAIGFKYKTTKKAFNDHRLSLLPILQEGVCITDAAGKITDINDKAIRMLKFPLRIGNEDFFETLEQNRPEFLKMFVDLKQAAEYKLICVKDSIQTGRSFFELKVSPIASNRGFIFIIQDQSDDRTVMEVGKNFIANASHELRTPITIIKGFAETLHELPEISDVMLEDITGKIVRNCDRMTSLVKNLLM